VVALTVTAGVAVASGLLLGWVLFSPEAPGTDSAEAGFARDMSEHHAQAVDMSLIALQRSDDREIDLLAYDIATTQGTQIGTMQGWLEQWDLPAARPEPRMAWMEKAMAGADSAVEPGDADYRPMPGMATTAEMDALESAPRDEVDVDYLEMMIRHHVAGVEMAQAAVESTDSPDVLRLAEAMVNGQRREIELMESLLSDREARSDA